jgi:hypothetical protein
VKDHTPNCEVRIMGTNNCTCGAVDESYPTATTNGVTDVEVLGPREKPGAGMSAPDAAMKASQPVVQTNDGALKLLRAELDTFSLMDNSEAATVCRVLRRLISRLEG